MSRVWAANEQAGHRQGQWRERLVPSGGFHLVLRLDDSRIRIFDSLEDARGRSFTAVVGGARSRFHVREATAGAYSVGMQIRPGAAGVILGVPAEELAEQHTSLEDVWGFDAGALRERLLEAHPAARQLEILEETVIARLDSAIVAPSGGARGAGPVRQPVDRLGGGIGATRHAPEPPAFRGAVQASGWPRAEATVPGAATEPGPAPGEARRATLG